MINTNEINRLGFDNWAFNKIVNEIENNNIYDKYEYLEDDYNFNVTKVGDKHTIIIRAYVPNSGWKTYEHSL